MEALFWPIVVLLHLRPQTYRARTNFYLKLIQISFQVLSPVLRVPAANLHYNHDVDYSDPSDEPFAQYCIFVL